MKMIKITLAFAILILTGNIWAQVAPAPLSTSQMKTGAEASSGAVNALGSPAGAKASRVLYAGHHRRLESVGLGDSFVKAALDAARSESDIVKFKAFLELMNNGRVSVNIKNQLEKTALHVVAFAGGPQSARVIKYLADRPDIDMNSVDSDGRTSLMEAMRNNQQEAFSLLVEYAKTKMATNRVIEAIDYAKEEREHFKPRLQKLLTHVRSRSSQVMSESRIAALNQQQEQEVQDRLDAKYLIGDADGGCGCLGSSTKTPVTKYTA